MTIERPASPVSNPPAPQPSADSPQAQAASEPHPSFWQQRAAQNIVPFFSSITVHAAIVILGIVTLKVVQVVRNDRHEDQVTPAETDFDKTQLTDIDRSPGPRLFDKFQQAQQDEDRTAVDPKAWNTHLDLTATSASDSLAGAGDNASATLIGIGPGLGFGPSNHGTGTGIGSNGPLAPFGAPQPGSGDGGGSIVFQPKRARSVAYVCDASGSMLNNFDSLRMEISKSVNALKPIQGFNVIFFQNESAASATKANLLMGTPENKRKAEAFLADISPTGTTDPIPALELAFKQKPELIFLLTDGDFPDNNAVVDFIRRHNADKRVQVNTIAFVNRGDEYERVLKTIASENHGSFQYVDEARLEK